MLPASHSWRSWGLVHEPIEVLLADPYPAMRVAMIAALELEPGLRFTQQAGELPVISRPVGDARVAVVLVDRAWRIAGRVFARCVFTTGDAMGMNMVNIAVDQVCRYAIAMTDCKRYYLRCNYSSDKKPAAIKPLQTLPQGGRDRPHASGRRCPNAPRRLDSRPARVRHRGSARRHGSGRARPNEHFANGLAAILHRRRPGRRTGSQRERRVHRRRARRRRRPLRLRAASQPRRQHRRGRDRSPDAKRMPRAARVPRRRHRIKACRDRRGDTGRGRPRHLRRACQRAVHRNPPRKPPAQPPPYRAAWTAATHAPAAEHAAEHLHARRPRQPAPGSSTARDPGRRMPRPQRRAAARRCELTWRSIRPG